MKMLWNLKTFFKGGLVLLALGISAGKALGARTATTQSGENRPLFSAPQGWEPARVSDFESMWMLKNDTERHSSFAIHTQELRGPVDFTPNDLTAVVTTVTAARRGSLEPLGFQKWTISDASIETPATSSDRAGLPPVKILKLRGSFISPDGRKTNFVEWQFYQGQTATYANLSYEGQPGAWSAANVTQLMGQLHLGGPQ